MGSYYYLMSRLPPLPEKLGGRLPGEFGWLASQARANAEPGHRGALEALLGEADIANYIFVRTRTAKRLPGGRLSEEDLAQSHNLPETIRSFLLEEERGITRAYPYDRLWEIYFSEAMAAAHRSGSSFLQNLLTWEFQLRNFLSQLRAPAADKEPASYVVRVGGDSYGFSWLAAELKEQVDPLNAALYLDGQRLRFISGCLDYDRFSLDALLGYLAQARIYDQWQDYDLPYDLQAITQAGEIK